MSITINQQMYNDPVHSSYSYARVSVSPPFCMEIDEPRLGLNDDRWLSAYTNTIVSQVA